MPSKTTFGIAAIRTFAERRVHESSLHAVASDIGMSYTGLRGFLGGGRPQTATRRKLVEWYTRRRDRRGAVGDADLDAAISLLGYYLREGSGTTTRAARFRAAIGRIAEEGRVPESWYEEDLKRRGAAAREPAQVRERRRK